MSSSVDADKPIHMWPSVGVLCIDIASTLLTYYEKDKPVCYIAGSYVKYLEAQGAQVVPLCNAKMNENGQTQGQRQGHGQGQGQGQGESEGVEQCTRHIGVMCIDGAQELLKLYEGGYSYLAASYIKYLETAGALVIPIWIGRKRAYYSDMMSQLNGVLLPGGAVFLEDGPSHERPELTNHCVKSARYIYELAMERNEAGEYFPIWGTCLGFQLLMISAAKANEVRTECGRMFTALPLQLDKDHRQSKLFADLTPAQAEQMESEPFACHQHRYCIEEHKVRDSALSKDWRILATQESLEPKKRFITLIEHRRFPIFGCQFHPERTAHEQLVARVDACHASHTLVGIKLAQYFADTFVAACRRNGNSFPIEQLTRHLIYNWQPVFSGQHTKSNWLQCYLFKKDEDYPAAVETLKEH